MKEENFGHGAIPSKKDKRDYKFIGQATTPFDWEKGFDIGDLKVKDQNGSGSCGGQAFAYYTSVLDNDENEKSAKFIYAQTFIPPAGTAGRDLCNLVVKKGVCDERLCLSYDNGKPPTEAFMERIEDITDLAYNNAFIDREISYMRVPNIDIESIAQAIRDNKGCVIGICGKNNGTWSSKFPKPPLNTDGAWRHWIYCGKARLIGGMKYIGFINSWGEEVGDKGWQWLDEFYIKSPYIWEAWTLGPRQKYTFARTLRYGDQGFDVKILQDLLGITVDGIFGKQTRLSVISFQIKNLLTPDGVVGPKTSAKLIG